MAAYINAPILEPATLLRMLNHSRELFALGLETAVKIFPI